MEGAGWVGGAKERGSQGNGGSPGFLSQHPAPRHSTPVPSRPRSLRVAFCGNQPTLAHEASGQLSTTGRSATVRSHQTPAPFSKLPNDKEFQRSCQKSREQCGCVPRWLRVFVQCNDLGGVFRSAPESGNVPAETNSSRGRSSPSLWNSTGPRLPLFSLKNRDSEPKKNVPKLPQQMLYTDGPCSAEAMLPR
ncbi:uncharacterized protein EI97DRAFT_92020 [Westerdykella ornata]|uniref:Uncharacterized protein n=1 Tax=Westerdykella ornata TaxID=318751 RepID=A0A6A6JFE6_WESOR|nr:uncharacterized protein EI97DRAFT_92020 [Westerdykella ornata]KAF2274883.1 hypothetical protein EI97DRAFT_92020 [Westerdykella ornata]